MNKKKAVKILQDRMGEFSSFKSAPNQIWRAKIKSNIEYFFGIESHEYMLITGMYFDNESFDYKAYLNDCIQTIKGIGLYRPNSIWKLVDRQNPALVWSILTVVVGLIFTSGVFYGNICCSSSKLTEKPNNLTDNKTEIKRQANNKPEIKNIIEVHNNSILSN